MSVKGLNAAAPAVCAVWPVVEAGARLGTLALFKSSGALKLSGGKAAEGAVIASKVADRTGITRSVIVNALRKLKNAGIIESRSLGMKGTYIKVLNHILTEELNKLRG